VIFVDQCVNDLLSRLIIRLQYCGHSEPFRAASSVLINRH